jgi:hypothetical protein
VGREDVTVFCSDICEILPLAPLYIITGKYSVSANSQRSLSRRRAAFGDILTVHLAESNLVKISL